MTPYCRAAAIGPTPRAAEERLLGLPRIDEVIRVAAWAFGVTVRDLTGPSRSRPLVSYRHAAMAAARALTAASLPAIGRAFGDRHHTTVAHGCRRAADSAELAELLSVFAARWQGAAELLERRAS